MADDWSREEVAATVSAYFSMLGRELRGEPFNKREHNRALQTMLHRRSAGAIEFKHANISAVLIELGFPYIDGYKPRSNYQDLLRSEVISCLEGDLELAVTAESVVDAPVAEPQTLVNFAEVFVPAPVREPAIATYEKRSRPSIPVRGINYLEREAKNAALGAAGEQFVLQVEHRRLWEAGKRELADKIEHVSHTKGDGLGYDVASFELDGRVRLIEVKTTAFGAMTPFFASSREVKTSESGADSFHLYRVFKYRQSPRIFVLRGSLRENCALDPVNYRAMLM